MVINADLEQGAGVVRARSLETDVLKFDMGWGNSKCPSHFTFRKSLVTQQIFCVRVVVVVGRLPQKALGGPFHAPRSSLPIKGTPEPLMRDTG
jgi:hypothetical protein